jgi:dephospho-CoA kinase
MRPISAGIQDDTMNPIKSTLIGITGNSGCGQTTAVSFIADRCSGICSLDRIGHRLLTRQYVQRELVSAFSREDLVCLSEDEIRAELGAIVFDDPEKLAVLNSILHPRMKKWVSAAASMLRNSEGIFVLEGALIYELGLDSIVDITIVIEDTAERAAERLVERDGISVEYAQKRWKYQLPIETKSSKADYVVHNSQDPDYMMRQILTIFDELERRILI